MVAIIATTARGHHDIKAYKLNSSILFLPVFIVGARNLFLSSTYQTIVTHIVIKASKIVVQQEESQPYYPKFAGLNLSSRMVVDSSKEDEFGLYLNSSIIEEQNFKHAMFLALRQGAAHF